MVKRNPHTGSGFDDFLKEEGVFEEVQAKALKRVLSEQLEDSMQALLGVMGFMYGLCANY